jgi:hypothetical protein
MNGQLWQECTICGTEPVCSDCEKCKKHCTCSKPNRQRIDPVCDDPYRRGIGQGFGAYEDGDGEEVE